MTKMAKIESCLVICWILSYKTVYISPRWTALGQSTCWITPSQILQHLLLDYSKELGHFCKRNFFIIQLDISTKEAAAFDREGRA
jgi:hypothetical protein